jgi:hypothetical protein
VGRNNGCFSPRAPSSSATTLLSSSLSLRSQTGQLLRPREVLAGKAVTHLQLVEPRNEPLVGVCLTLTHTEAHTSTRRYPYRNTVCTPTAISNRIFGRTRRNGRQEIDIRTEDYLCIDRYGGALGTVLGYGYIRPISNRIFGRIRRTGRQGIDIQTEDYLCIDRYGEQQQQHYVAVGTEQ